MAERLIQMSEKVKNNDLWDGSPNRTIRIVEKFFWKTKSTLLAKTYRECTNKTAVVISAEMNGFTQG